MNDYEYLQRWLDKESADEAALDGIGMTAEELFYEAENYRRRFFELLKKYSIQSENISRIIADICRNIKAAPNSDTLFLYTSVLLEKELLFGGLTDREQIIFLWLEQRKKDARR